jgi:hypothetical protein
MFLYPVPQRVIWTTSGTSADGGPVSDDVDHAG